MFVVGISCTEARDQSFRFRKDLGLPNQVSLFRYVLYSVVAINLQMETRQVALRSSLPPICSINRSVSH